MEITITRARHAWQEDAGFCISRPRGIREYTFLHFQSEVSLLVDGERVTAPPGSCILYGVDTPQWFHSTGALIHDWMHLTGDVLPCLQEVGLEADRLYFVENSWFITEILRTIEMEILTKPEHYRLVSVLKFQELMARIARSCQPKGAFQRLKPGMERQLMQVRSQVFAHLDRPWTVAEMAALAYTSPSRFHAVYRSLFGISPMDDLIRARIDTARNRLADTGESVRDLAESLGYRNVTHFCRQFKQFTGVTPGQFRQLQR